MKYHLLSLLIFGFVSMLNAESEAKPIEVDVLKIEEIPLAYHKILTICKDNKEYIIYAETMFQNLENSSNGLKVVTCKNIEKNK